MLEKAFDINGTEIKHNDIVKIVRNPRSSHYWLREGNTLRVAYWENRSFSNTGEYIVVFLKSKNGGKLCSLGIQDRLLKVIEAKGDVTEGKYNV